MKKTKILLPLSALLLILVSGILSGCRGNKSADYLAYQREGGSYICKITTGNASYEALLELGERMKLTFRSPETLADYRFEESEEGIRLFCGDLELSVGDAELPERVFALFRLSDGDFLSASHEKVSGEEITVVNFAGGEVLRLSSEGTPLMLTEGDLTVNVIHREA